MYMILQEELWNCMKESGETEKMVFRISPDPILICYGNGQMNRSCKAGISVDDHVYR